MTYEHLSWHGGTKPPRTDTESREQSEYAKLEQYLKQSDCRYCGEENNRAKELCEKCEKRAKEDNE